ncbi:hypothetical protein IFM89_031440 [Coptis chinensis]|uniref:Pentatricopeptide repeat-containing protein n=1 Tax=Coptis chinensis TaxID=261450 RepID=A0A835HI86_9MAGN|nr:hypothetical protein IFM89_031440 [Coptis chinensis]
MVHHFTSELLYLGFPPCPSAYCGLIDALGKAKRYWPQNELFWELKKRTVALQALGYIFVMIKHFGKCGPLLGDAIDLFNEMRKLGCSRCVCLQFPYVGMVRGGMIDEAHSLLQTMEEEVLVGLGMFEEAVRLMKEMSSNGFDYDLITYSSILERDVKELHITDGPRRLMRVPGMRESLPRHAVLCSLTSESLPLARLMRVPGIKAASRGRS